MKNLINIGFNQELIDELIEKEGFASIDALNNNVDNVVRIITIIKELGIEDINEFMLTNTSIFYQDYKKIMSIIEKSDAQSLVEKIKEDNNYLAEYIYSNL